MPATLVPMNEQKPENTEKPTKPRKTRSKSNFLVFPVAYDPKATATSMKEAKKLVADLPDDAYIIVCVRAKLTVTTETTRTVKAVK